MNTSGDFHYLSSRCKVVSRPGALEAVEALQQRIGVPRRLRETGLDRSLLARLAKSAMSDRRLYFNPRLATEAEALALLEAAW